MTKIKLGKRRIWSNYIFDKCNILFLQQNKICR